MTTDKQELPELFEKCGQCDGDGSYGQQIGPEEFEHVQCEYCMARGFIPHVPAKAEDNKGKGDGETSDGYHTFNELYEHRHALFIALAKAYPDKAWKSWEHDDGSLYEGWFIAGIETLEGQATYHLPARLWDSFIGEFIHRAPKWDGHTPDDVIKRIGSLSQAQAQKGGS